MFVDMVTALRELPDVGCVRDLQLLMPSYRATRVLWELVLETLPMSVLQLHVRPLSLLRPLSLSSAAPIPSSAACAASLAADLRDPQVVRAVRTRRAAGAAERLGTALGRLARPLFDQSGQVFAAAAVGGAGRRGGGARAPRPAAAAGARPAAARAAGASHRRVAVHGMHMIYTCVSARSGCARGLTPTLTQSPTPNSNPGPSPSPKPQAPAPSPKPRARAQP